MKLTLTLMLVAVLVFSLPLVGCKKETAPGNNAANVTAPTDNGSAANVPAANVPAANVPAANVPAANVPASTPAANTPTPTTGPAT